MASANAKFIAVTTVLGAAITAGVIYKFYFTPVNLYREIPTEVFTRQPEIQAAYRKHMDNGGTYIWGANDCSIFVMNYLIASNKTPPFRPTTATLMDLKFMGDLGLRSDSTITKTGDIIVFRYKDKENKWLGHTGVVAWHNNRLWAIHNSGSYKGVVMEDLKQFKEKALLLTENNKDLYRVYRRTDYDSWYAQFKKRRNQI